MAAVVAGDGIPAAVPDVYSRDAIIAWFRGEFAAANAIIDALCGHLVQIGGGDGSGEYDGVFAAIHRRRLNWIPVLHMQKYYSIADVYAELRRVAASRTAVPFPAAPKAQEVVPPGAATETEVEKEEKVAVLVAEEKEEEEEEAAESPTCVVDGAGVEETTEEDFSGDSSDQKTTEDGEANGGSHEKQTSVGNVKFCSDHDDCLARPDRINILKGFVAKEAVKGHMVNVVKGLKVYEDIFTETELLRLSKYIDELRLAGHRGELSGESFILFNKQMKGNKKEIIQLGVPLFQQTNEDATSNIEAIPPFLQTVIDHLVQWRLIPESRKPNCCIINFFDEDEHSQPYFKPPHLDNPISTLVLSETTMAFGRALLSDSDGNYKGSLTLQVKEGSLLVMRGNSADMARHVICASDNKRVSITFVKVRPANTQVESPMATSQTKAMTIWQPGTAPLQKVSSAGIIAYGPPSVNPAAWGLALRAPVVMLAPPRPMVISPNKQTARGGTGVFLPWTVSPKKYTKHLPPRIQKRRLPSLPSTLEAQA